MEQGLRTVTKPDRIFKELPGTWTPWRSLVGYE